uniref:Uncharacterized protein n=1 Tax=Arundo donax TaxID=35708 RepID=A0A0A9I601_ARUDO
MDRARRARDAGRSGRKAKDCSYS